MFGWLRLDVLLGGRHRWHWYWSTHCRHGDHAACAATVINGGPRLPAQCKVCRARCRCSCHRL